MSGDLTYVQSEMVTNEFIDHIKSLSVSQSPNTYADAIKDLQLQFKRAAPNGLKDNRPLAVCIADNFYRMVPILDLILMKDDETSDEFIQATKILDTFANSFRELCLFNLFSNVKDTQQLRCIFKNNIGLVKESYFTGNRKFESLINCLLPIIGFSSIFISITEDDIPSNLLQYLLTYTKQHWQSTERELTVRNVFSLMKVFSKKPTLVPMIFRADWPKACLQYLGNPGTRPAFIIDYYIYLILQKLARHTAAVEGLKELNCLQVLDGAKEQMRKDHTEHESNLFDFLYCMIYALLIEANAIKQLSLLTDCVMCLALDKLVLYTLEASRSESFCYECFHICEILDVMTKLFVNDEILIKCMDGNNELFDCLCQLVIQFTRNDHLSLPFAKETLLTVANLMWSISFHQTYQEKFRSNSELMHALSDIASSSSLYTSTSVKSTARDMCSVKKAAEGILWNLKSHLPQPVTKTLNAKAEQQQPLAMISYSHSDSTFCRELVERLSPHVPVWVDYKQAHDAVAHSDDLWEEIARAMEMASVIVLIISKEYYDSKSCRQELSYAADTLKKRIVPIYAPNQQYRASGWLGIRIAGQKYIHFGRKPFAEAIKELSAMVVTDQKQLVITSQSSPPPPPSETTPPAPILEKENKLLTLRDWTTKDIRKWFDYHHIHSDLITLYEDRLSSGAALLIYARHLKLFYRNEYIQIVNKYHKLFPEKTLDTLHFITLVDALYRLRMEYDGDYTIEDNFEKSNEQQLPHKMNAVQEGMTWL